MGYHQVVASLAYLLTRPRETIAVSLVARPPAPAKMETEWTPQMMQHLGIDAASLPIIWDADFLYGPRDASGADTYVRDQCQLRVCLSR
jgi:hypothetical protein